MILEVDCGNTFIKWRILSGSEPGVSSCGTSLDQDDFFAQLDAVGNCVIRKARVVSVRSESVTSALIQALQAKYSIRATLAYSGNLLAGVTNGYQEPSSLGTDRWLALVAGFVLCQSPCLVLDVGTAVTADFVDEGGHHLGGFIGPGLGLMREQLVVSTARIRYQSCQVMGVNRPGINTAEAVERGTELMLLGFVEAQLQIANDYWGERFCLLATGGGADLVKQKSNHVKIVPDLVFRGLALACPD